MKQATPNYAPPSLFDLNRNLLKQLETIKTEVTNYLPPPTRDFLAIDIILTEIADRMLSYNLKKIANVETGSAADNKNDLFEIHKLRRQSDSQLILALLL
jgi:hypothetical protein